MTPALLAALTIVAAPPAFHVVDVAVAGSGCAPERSTVEVDARQRLALTLEGNFAQVAEGIPADEAARDCDVSVTLSFPAGWQVAARGYEMLGQAWLDPGLLGSAQLLHHNGATRAPVIAETIAGPVNADYHFDASAEALAWSACGAGEASVKLGTRLALTATEPFAEGFLGQCSCGNPDVRVTLVWRRC